MTITSARELFALRYYEWAKGWLRQEAQSDFPVLRSLKETQAAAYLKFLSRFDRENQRWNSECLQDRFHLTALQMLGRNVTTECEESVLEYRQFALGCLQRGDQLEPKVRRTELRRILKTELSKLSQLEVESPGGGELRLIARIGDTLITSSVGTGSQMYDLTYSHSVAFSKRDVIVEHLSVLSWCGISSQTMWMDISESRAATVASGVRSLVEAFLDASRDLVGDFRL